MSEASPSEQEAITINEPMSAGIAIQKKGKPMVLRKAFTGC